MERQEVFDKVATHLIKQGEACTEPHKGSVIPTCLYRNSKGQKCAAGALILDEHYSEDLETNLVTETIVEQALIASGVNPDDLELVERLQSIHDEEDVDAWERALVAAGHEYDLDIPDILK